MVALLVAALLPAACGGDGEDTNGGNDANGDSGQAAALEIVTFSPPSLGAFLPAVIESERFDLDNGLDLAFVHRPPDAYNTEFGTGQFAVGGSGSLMSEAVRLTQGVDVLYLFNVHDFWGGLVSTNPDLTELADLDDHSLAAVTSSTNYAMFLWFAQQDGVDIENLAVENVQTAALATMAGTGRSDAVQIWEPAYSVLMAEAHDHLIDIPIGLDAWEAEFGFDEVPFLGVAAHRSWVEENADLVPQLQATYADAAEWSLANPADAAQIIADSMEGGDVEALTDLLSDNDRLGLNVRSAADVRDGIEAVFQAGVDIGYFEEAPSLDVVYDGE